MKRDKDRREFLIKLGIGGGIAALARPGRVASLRSLVPNVSYDSPTTVKAGDAGRLSRRDEVPVRTSASSCSATANVFHAVSAVCTHLGCTVRAEALSKPETRDSRTGKPLRLTHRFLCPCHGSKYNGDGTNVSGPAPKPLAWYHLDVAPEDGQLVVDLARPVDRDFRLTLA